MLRAAVPDLAIIGQEGSRAIAVHDDEERRACAPLLLQGWGRLEVRLCKADRLPLFPSMI